MESGPETCEGFANGHFYQFPPMNGQLVRVATAFSPSLGQNFEFPCGFVEKYLTTTRYRRKAGRSLVRFQSAVVLVSGKAVSQEQSGLARISHQEIEKGCHFMA